MAVEAYIDSKDTVRDCDHGMREHLMRTGELARREGANRVESYASYIGRVLLQPILEVRAVACKVFI
jgi:hypothetical protein